MMKFSSGGVMAAGAVGLLTVAVVLSRNAFLMTNIMEMVHRCQHAIVGDRYENIRALVDFEPWFGKKDGVAVVTGSNSGLGFETALGLARTGCRVVLAVRSKEKGDEAAVKIRKATGNDKVDVMILDMGSVDAVRAFAKSFIERNLPLHVLIHNAGAAGKTVAMNADGLESTMALNYLNVVLLNSLLLPAMKATNSARIVIVGSSAHFAGVRDVSLCLADRSDPPVSGWDLYGSSKLNVVAYSKVIARKLSESSSIHVCSLDPGFVASAFYKKDVPFPVSLFGTVADFVAKTPEKGAHSSLFAALAPSPPTQGAYIADTMESTPSALASSIEFQEQLIDVTVKKLKVVAPWWDGVWF